MHQSTRLLLTTLLLSASMFAQQKAAPAKTPIKGATKTEVTKSTAETKVADGSGNSSLPTEATVMGFLKRMFGYDSNLVFKVTEIKESDAPGIAEATAIV